MLIIPHEEVVGRAVGQVLNGEGIELDGRSESFSAVWEGMRRALLEHARRDLQALRQDFTRRDGDALFAGLDGTAAPVKRVAPTLGGLIKAYQEDPSRAGLSPKSRFKDEARARLFKEVIGESKPVNEITREDAAGLLSLLSALPANATKKWPKLKARQAAEKAKEAGIPPMSATSAKWYFTAFGSLMRFAQDRGWRDDNPAERLKVRACSRRLVKRERGRELRCRALRPCPRRRHRQSAVSRTQLVASFRSSGGFQPTYR
jgi:hypothetical protein